MNPPTATLAAGMLLGIAAAAWTLAGDGEALPDAAAARVNGRLITEEAWQRAVAAVASERRTPLTDDDKRRILDRLVDEELLVQHGLDLGLIEHDRRLRGLLVSEVMAAAAAAVEEPDLDALRRYYDEHRDYFSSAGRLRVAARRTQPDGREVDPASPLPVPDALLTPSKLQTYLGPTLTQAALALPAGHRSAPLESNGAYIVLEVRERESAAAPPFEDIVDTVREAVLREREEQAVRELLRDLREDGEVRLRGSPNG